MATRRNNTTNETMQGFGIPNTLYNKVSSLAANSATTTTSTYTEATPRPGSALSGDALAELVPQVSGGQTADVDIYCSLAGNPGREGCELLWKLDSEAAAASRGWMPPYWLNNWSIAKWAPSGGNDWTSFATATIPSNQKVVLLRANATTPGLRADIWDPSTFAWTGDVSISTTADTNLGNAIVVLPGSERILSISKLEVRYSDDDSATWALYSGAPFGTITTSAWTDRARASFNRGNILYLVKGAGTDVHQLASNDLGTRFSLVLLHSSLGSSHGCVALPDGTFGVYYVSSNTPKWRVLGSAYQSIADATEVEITSTTVIDLAIGVDANGTLWSFTRENTDEIQTRFSVDNGATWTIAKALHWSGAAADFMDNYDVSFTGSAALLSHQWTASTGTQDKSIGSLLGGGWTNVTHNQAASDPLNGRGVWAADGSRPTWVPVELPSDGPGYALTGTAGTLTSTGMEIATSAATGFYTQAAAANTLIRAIFQVQVDVGGALTSADIAFGLRGADNTDDYEVVLRFSSAGFSAVDANNSLATLGTDAVVDNSTWTQVMVQINAGTLTTWYRKLGTTLWVAGPTDTMTNDNSTPNAAGQVQFGNAATATATSRWMLVGWDDGSASLLLNGNGNVCGKAITSIPTPVPGMGTSTASGFLSATGGPGRVADTWDIDARYDHPVENLLILDDPSPAKLWRSNQVAADEIFVFDTTDATTPGKSICLMVLNANFRLAYLEEDTDTDGANWTIVATLDMQAEWNTSGVTYDLVGDILTPRASTINPDRPLQENELAGGMAILNVVDPRKIISNTAGVWADDAATAQAQIRIDNIDSTEAANGTLQIISHSGIVFHHTDGATFKRRYRVRIPNQTTPASEQYYEAKIGVFSVRPMGQSWAWAWSQRKDPNVSRNVGPSGTVTKRELGKHGRTWVVDYTDHVRPERLRVATTDLDYIGPTAGTELALYEDVWTLAWGLLDLLKGGEYPVLCLANIPNADDTTILDPTLWLYATWESAAQYSNVAGSAGIDEIGRVDPLTFVEIV